MAIASPRNEHDGETLCVLGAQRLVGPIGEARLVYGARAISIPLDGHALVPYPTMDMVMPHIDIRTAYALASEIEWIHAKDRVRLMRLRGRGNGGLSMMEAANIEYDELAATALGDLIYTVATGGKWRQSRKQSRDASRVRTED